MQNDPIQGILFDASNTITFWKSTTSSIKAIDIVKIVENNSRQQNIQTKIKNTSPNIRLISRQNSIINTLIGSVRS